MLYLQIRRGILENQIRCSAHEIMTFASLALQAEFGDFNNEEHGNGDYFLLEHYIPDHFLPPGRKEQEFLHDLLDLHRSRKGLDPGRAEELFVAQAMQLPEYGFHFLSALTISSDKDESNCDVWLGISGKGITVCPKESCTDPQTPRSKLTSHATFFAWNQIKKLTYTKQNLEIISKGASSKMKLKMQSNKSFSAFHLASLHHKFFLKLRNEMSSLHSLSQEFGISVKSNGRSCQTIGVHYLGSKSSTGESLKRSSSFCSPDRVIFRGKTASHCAIDNNRSIQRRNDLKLSRRKEPEIERIDSGEDTFWQHSPFAEQEISSAPASPTTESSQSWQRRLRAPLMGTRAFLGASQAELRRSHSPLPQVYVLNSSIKSIDDKYHVDFQETISESLAEKFDEIPFVDERILTTVR
ncbi:tyrosine-protein phosphatase non-receptor type 13 [Nilaparvata lugens]|uniref:tyrosine-protein phosphatase non-receptor type 13 n=1 Tax=Nilaparvata lugens TaxID=108931 RepID=UPI00193D3F1B|nr:tyrosine-protein phosphatase non-receptor type 13 [Nilaparvata lugens]